MPNLMPFWRLLETRTSRTAVRAAWQQVSGGCFAVIKPLLQPTGGVAITYPGRLRIVHHDDGSIVGISERDWEHRRELTRDDVLLYRLDLTALRKLITDALSHVQISRTPIDVAAGRLQVGSWEPKKAAAFPVHLLLCRQRAELQWEILTMAADGRKPGAILLTPTRANWDDHLDALARERRRLLVPLCEVVGVSDGRLAETAAWEEYLQGFCQMTKLTLPGNYRNKKPMPRRAELAAKIEQVKHALVGYIRSARDHAVARIDAGDGARRLKFLTRSDLAKLAGLKPFHITRCFEADPQLEQLHMIANDPEQMLKYRGR